MNRPKLLPTTDSWILALGGFREAVPQDLREGSGLPSSAIPSPGNRMVFSVTAIREQDGCFYSPQCPLCSQLSVD